MTVTTQLSYVYADHIDTPRVVVRASDHAMQWRWDDAEAFGATPPNENPSGLGVFRFNQRFPGQVFDAETGNFYNGNRDYRNWDGRYLQVDPIGLAGGINPFSYAFANPISYFDPDGLDVEVGVRKFSPVPAPYARHCFVRFNQDNAATLSFDNQGVHSDPSPGIAIYSKTTGNENDACVKKEMNQCKSDQYDFLDFNCCMCVANALNACGLEKIGPWPNAPRDASKPP